ncbi:MAG TPA: AAC(3) family N-acetyltransferase [Clostridiaceae bacterium]|nr:AAC(3) family N-acetyltransferase [Clostridiaceae bacterium]
MGEKEIIDLTDKPNTVASMVKALRKLGVRKGDILLVHSSLSMLGWVCGGPQAVILALQQVVGDKGTVVMPAHSGDWSDPAEWAHPPVPKDWIPVIRENMPAYDPKMTPTRGVGILPECFRSFPGVIRSGHPQVSFAAWGKRAEKVTEDHPLTPQMGMQSPLGKLYDDGAKVLFIGTEFDTCTGFHLAEALIPDMAVKQAGTAVMEDGVRVWKEFEDFDYDSSDFGQLGLDFERNHPVKRGKVGNAQCRLFDLRQGVDFAKDWMEQNRDGGKVREKEKA